jgi:hypothetical protein
MWVVADIACDGCGGRWCIMHGMLLLLLGWQGETPAAACSFLLLYLLLC